MLIRPSPRIMRFLPSRIKRRRPALEVQLECPRLARWIVTFLAPGDSLEGIPFSLDNTALPIVYRQGSKRVHRLQYNPQLFVLIKIDLRANLVCAEVPPRGQGRPAFAGDPPLGRSSHL